MPRPISDVFKYKMFEKWNHSLHPAHATDYPWPVTFETAILLTADLRCYAEMSNDRKWTGTSL